MNNLQKIRVIAEYVLLVITATFSILIAALDIIGVLDASSWLAQRVPTLTLLGIGFIASYLVIERRGKLDQLSETQEQHHLEVTTLIEENTHSVVSALQGVEVKKYDDGSLFMSYFLSQIKKAKTVDDTSWGDGMALSSQKEQSLYRQYQDEVTKIASKPNTIWREVAMIRSDEHYERIKSRLEADMVSYSVAHYEPLPLDAPPRLSFAIVDKEEVFLAGNEMRLVIRHPDIARYFSSYYEKIWNRAQPIKVGRRVADATVLEHIENALKRR